MQSSSFQFNMWTKETVLHTNMLTIAPLFVHQQCIYFTVLLVTQIAPKMFCRGCCNVNQEGVSSLRRVLDLIYWDREINHFIFGDWTQMTHHGRQNRILVLIGVRTESTSEWLRSGGGVESERENDRRVQSFKAHRVDDDWLNEGSENMIELE